MSTSRAPQSLRPSSSAAAEQPDDGFDVTLATDHCRQLLASVRVSRVAFIDEGLPQLVVMNHLPDGHDVLFQTGENTRLAELTRDGRTLAAVVEVDSVSTSGRTGWSVIGSGSLARDTSSSIATVPVPWRPGATGVFLRLSISSLAGREVGPAAR
jgi:Pyridoxamine 5'-phosphate oxidase